MSAFRHHIAQIVEHAVLEEDHRVVVADGGDHQSLGVGRRRRHHHLQPRNMRDPGMERLRMLGAQIGTDADGGAQDQRHTALPAREVMDLGGLIDELVHHERDEIAEHHLEHRPLARHGGADRHAERARFGDRRVDHALGAEFGEQAFGLLEHAAGRGHVLAEEGDGGIAAHLAEQGFEHRGPICE
jgi:hypothetical protein